MGWHLNRHSPLWGMFFFFSILSFGNFISSKRRLNQTILYPVATSFNTPTTLGGKILPLQQPSLPQPPQELPPQPPPTKSPCMIVYHIPKTGGTSMEIYLKQLEKVLGWKWLDWERTKSRRRDNVPSLTESFGYQSTKNFTDQFIHEGHITPGFENYTNTQNCYKVTVLREPIDRVISAFYFHGHKHEHWYRCLYERCWKQFEYINDVVRRFAGKTNWWHSFNEEKYVVGEELPPNDLTTTDLEAAKQRLLSFDAVCFLHNMTACFQEFVDDTFVGLNVTFSDQIKRKNKGERKKPVKEALRQKIGQVNSLDVQLHEWAVETFAGKNSLRSYRTGVRRVYSMS